jgi:hypothetical protein
VAVTTPRPERADDSQGDDGDDAASEPSRQVLTARADDSLRECAVGSDGTAHEWERVTKQFDDYLMNQNAAADTIERERGFRPQSHRFTERYAQGAEGKVRGGLRHVNDHTPPELNLTTILITRTGWPFDTEGHPAPPVDYLNGLSEGRRAATRTLRRTLDDHDGVVSWGRATIVEPHEGRRSGYPHAHDGLAVVERERGALERSALRRAVDAHVSNDPFARERDHGPAALRIEREGDVESLAAELTNNLVGYAIGNGHPVHDTPDPILRFAALMWATGKQSVTFGSTFREWVNRSQDDYDGDGDGSAPPSDLGDDGPDPVEYVDPEPTSVAYEFPA